MRDLDETIRFMEHRLNIWKGFFGLNDSDMKFRAQLDPEPDTDGDQSSRLDCDGRTTTMYLGLGCLQKDDEALDKMAFEAVLGIYLMVFAALSTLTTLVERNIVGGLIVEPSDGYKEAKTRQEELARRLNRMAVHFIWSTAGCSLCKWPDNFVKQGNELASTGVK